MYEFLLPTHNLLRWILLVLMLIVLFLSWSGWLGKKVYGKKDKALGGALVGLTHLQLVIGLLLYFAFSPQAEAARSNFGMAMKDAHLRMIVMEHPLLMLVAVFLIQLGRTLSKKAALDVDKHKKVAVYTTIALLLILSRMPNWNFL